jgi:hypothetical protein
LAAQLVQGVQTGEPRADHYYIERQLPGIVHKRSR